MYQGKHAKKISVSFGSVLYWTVGSLLVLTMLSVWLTSGLFAKYIVSDTVGDTARVAAAGTVDIWEHKAEETYENSGVYELLKEDSIEEEDLVKKNEYEKVLPGVDIPKDPFVTVDLSMAEVDYYLYLEITESADFPKDEVKYNVRSEWKLVSGEDANPKVYVYVGNGNSPRVFDCGNKYGYENDTIWILDGNKLEIKEHYFGGGTDGFGLAFSAYIRQVD